MDIFVLSLQSYEKLFYKFVTYYMFNNNYNIDTWNIRRQIVGYVMSVKRERRMKIKTKSCAEVKYHLVLNNVLTSSSILLQSNTHKGYCILNTTGYNYKLRSVISRQEDDFKVTKWTWFNKQVWDIFYVHGWYHRSWLITQTLEEPLTIYLTWCMLHPCQWRAVLDLQPHSFIHQW